MDQNTTTRVLLVTFCAQGHINPALQFAKRLTRHRRGLHVTFLTSLSAYRRMAETPTFPNLSFASFSDGYDDGFDPKEDGTNRFMSELERLGSKAVKDMITTGVDRGQPFTCIVHSMFLPWVATVARSLHVPSYLLWIQPAIVFALYYYFNNGYRDQIQRAFNDDDPLTNTIQLPGLPLLTGRDLPSFFDPSDVYDFVLPIFRTQFQLLEQETDPKILVNTFEELEHDALQAVSKFNLIPIGPLISSAFLDGKDSSEASSACDLFQPNIGYMEWLKSKPKGSVIYVSSGSILTLSKEQQEEIGRGLLMCGRPFLWVIRDDDDIEELQSHNAMRCFRDELEGMGKIVQWCSQLEVLSSPATGCFVTHCGWNSCLESLACGVPTVAFPQWADQGTNAKIIRDMSETGVRLEVVERGEIHRCLELVMGDSKRGEEIRRNALKWKDLAKEAAALGGSSHANFNAFVDQLFVPTLTPT